MLEGFFSKEDIDHIRKKEVSFRKNRCLECGHNTQCKSPKIPFIGYGKKSILLVTDHINESEDVRNEILSGASGTSLKRLYRDLYDSHSLHSDIIFDDCVVTSAIRCCFYGRGGTSKKPSKEEIEYCRPSLFRLIEKHTPKVIVLMGESAIKSFLQHRWPRTLDADEDTGKKRSSFESVVKRWRGWPIPDQEYGCWVVCTFDHNYLTDERAGAIPHLIASDLYYAVCMSELKFPNYKSMTEQSIKIATSDDEVKDFLFFIKHNKSKIAFDYETTGLKPYYPGHKIYSASVCAKDETNRYISMAFLLNDNTKRYLSIILNDPSIPKVAHNAKFEDQWTWEILGTRVHGWEADTMLYTHYLDNRAGATGLKFQTYVNFGIIDYASEVDPYLKNKKGEVFNRIEEAPIKKLLYYNAQDSLYTLMLHYKQIISN